MAQKFLRLKTSDDQTLEVEEKIVKMFGVLKTMLEDLGGSGDGPDDAEPPTPVQVESKILQQVITWCEHHKNDKPEEAEADDDDDSSSEDELSDDDSDEFGNDREQYKRDKKFDISLDPWDEKFLKGLDPSDENAVFPLIVAANFLDIPKLLDISCKYVAGMMRGRTPQWIRKRFNLKCDFTEEQKAKIREELSWYDDNVKISDDEEPMSASN